jgi:hypothetical protein
VQTEIRKQQHDDKTRCHGFTLCSVPTAPAQALDFVTANSFHFSVESLFGLAAPHTLHDMLSQLANLASSIPLLTKK